MSESLHATGTLFRFLLRRDRIRIGLWVAGLIGIMAASAFQIPPLYDDPASIQGYVDSVGDNPALVLFAGPGYGFDEPTVGAILVNETALWMSLACGLMSLFLINRATRLEEDAERADLVRAGVVGRHAPTVAAMLVVVLANIVVAIGGIVACVAAGFAVAGSIALCVSIAAVGVAFAAVALVTAQVAPGSRTNLGLGGALMGAMFLLRGVGDIAWSALSWLTPFGWGIGIRAFAGERWWTLLGLAVFSVLLTAVAFALSNRRDLGSGLFPTRPGDPVAPGWMTTPLGLTVRLQRSAVISWAAGLFAMGTIYGSIGNEIEQLIEDNPQMADFLAALGEASLTDSYLAMAASMLAMMASGFAVSSMLRLRSGEQAGWAELVLARPVPRLAWAAAHVVVAAVGTVLVLAAAGTGIGLGYALVIGDAGQVPRLLGAALALAPAALVFVGLAVALVGWARRASVAAWGVFAAVLAVGIFGELIGLPEALRSWSPFEQSAAVPAEPVEWAPLVLLSVVAVGLAVAGLLGFRRRDLDTQ